MFILYMAVFFFILLGMFVTIINEAFAAVSDDNKKQSNDYEMVDFMVGRFKQWTGLSGLKKRLGRENPDEHNNSEVHNNILCI